MRAIQYLVLTLSLVVVSLASARENSPAECQVSYLFNAWARPTVAAAPNGAIYGQLVNIGSLPDTLVGASTTVAEAVELHEMRMGAGDVMQMRPLPDGVMVPPNSFVALEPGGLHIMLIGLAQELTAGDSIELSLYFERAGEVMLVVPVQDMSEETMEMDADMAMDAEDDMVTPEISSMDWGDACANVYFLGSWVRPAVPGAPNSAAYGLLVNLTPIKETLVSVSTVVAEVAELHEMRMVANDVMQMRPLADGIHIPAGGATLLEPGGLHIMLINLQGLLPVDEHVEFTLSFAESDDINVTIPVREPAMDGMQMHADN